MDFRTRRQLVVLAIAAVVVGGIGFLIVRASLPEPSCQDNRRNQGEEAVDCGGPCIPCALRESKPIEVFWARSVQVRANTYDVAAEIRNPNIKLAAASFDYEFKLYDTAGVNVASRRGRSFLYPGETAHLIEIGLLSGRTIRNAALAIGDTAWALSDAVGPDVIAGSKEYVLEGEPGAPFATVRALVVNRGLADLPGVNVTAVVFDAGGNLLGAHRIVIENLAAGASQPVRFAWPAVFPLEPSALAVEAHSPALLPQRRP